jgi:hypothetical protein
VESCTSASITNNSAVNLNFTDTTDLIDTEETEHCRAYKLSLPTTGKEKKKGALVRQYSIHVVSAVPRKEKNHDQRYNFFYSCRNRDDLKSGAFLQVGATGS